jgi:hypothetical protein
VNFETSYYDINLLPVALLLAAAIIIVFGLRKLFRQ